MIKNKIIIIVFSLFFTYFFSYYSYSVEPDEILNNKEQETRARNISKNIRCLVCQNQSIDESNAPLAKDLRILIKQDVDRTIPEVAFFQSDKIRKIMCNVLFIHAKGI